jgi:site-specific recombinase XerD
MMIEPPNQPLLSEAFSDFCSLEMPALHLSPVTRVGYTYDLSEWLSQMPSLYVSHLSTERIQLYLTQLEERGLKSSTRRRKVAAIKTFLRYLEREGSLPPDYSDSLVWPERPGHEPQALTPAEYRSTLECVFDSLVRWGPGTTRTWAGRSQRRWSIVRSCSPSTSPPSASWPPRLSRTSAPTAPGSGA